MFLLNPEPRKITAANLQALIDDQVIESRDIEYKRIVAIGPKADEKKKVKLLAGISSFANTDGGDFVIGLRAESGIPKEITPIERTQLDSLKLAIEQLIQTGISPRISPAVCEIPVTNTHSALLVRIEKSWAAPHRVTLAGDNNFYGRHSSGMYPMDVDQLRAAFMTSGTVHERIRQVREQLVNRIKAPHSPKLCGGPSTVLHMIPYESLDPVRVFDLRPARSKVLDLVPVANREIGELRFNFDGLLARYMTLNKQQASEVCGYTQVFRNGIIESVDASLLTRLQFIAVDPPNVIPSQDLEVELLTAFTRFLRVQKSIGVALPVMVFVSLLGVRDYFLARDLRFAGIPGHRFERDDLMVQGEVVDSWDADRGTLFKPIFDVIWNAGGYERCLDYKETGELSIAASAFQHEVVM
jgi:hypothetical protein